MWQGTLFYVFLTVLVLFELTLANACNGPNEIYKCGSLCQRECATLGQRCPIVNIKCNNGCYCINGYARNSRGKCIPEDKCPAKVAGNSYVQLPGTDQEQPDIESIEPESENQCSGRNEVYKCGSSCQIECATLGQPCRNPSNRCIRGCYCKSGYARDVHGKCIPIKTCPLSVPESIFHEPELENQCSDSNEVYKCGSACQIECATLGKPCRDPSNKCVNGCYCKTGYARDFYGKCIPSNTCPIRIPPPVYYATQRCGRNEYYTCGSACQTECATLGKPCSIINVRCNNGCYCIGGYARNNKGMCIPIRNCPRKVKPQIPVFPTAVDEEDSYIQFPEQEQEQEEEEEEEEEEVEVEVEEEGEDESEYDEDTPELESILSKPKRCTGQNEVYNNCGSRCREQCRQNKVCPAVCNTGCFCKAGYARDRSGKCIPNKICPVKVEGHTKGYRNNPEAHTEIPSPSPTRCPGRNQVSACEKCLDGEICTRECKLTCICKAGYMRNIYGQCIPRKNQPKRTHEWRDG